MSSMRLGEHTEVTHREYFVVETRVKNEQGQEVPSYIGTYYGMGGYSQPALSRDPQQRYATLEQAQEWARSVPSLSCYDNHYEGAPVRILRVLQTVTTATHAEYVE